MKTECQNCSGKGWYATGPVDHAVQVQCEWCKGTCVVDVKDSPLCREDFLAAESKSEESAAMVQALETCAMMERLLTIGPNQIHGFVSIATGPYGYSVTGPKYYPTLHQALKHAVEANGKV